MLDLGWTELLLIGIVALIVVGPKDLPGMFRAVGNFVGKAKRMARDFSQAMNDAADEAGVGDVKKTFDAAANPMKSAMNEVKKSTDSFTARTMAGPAGKPPLSPERAEAKEKISKRAAELAEERMAAEAKAREEAARAGTAKPDAASDDKPAPGPSTAKKTTARKAPASKAPAKAAPAAPTKAKTTKAKTATAKTTAGKPTARKKAEDKA